MSEYLSSYDPHPHEGAFHLANRTCCRLHVPYYHTLDAVWLCTQNVVTTGTVTITLKKSRLGDAAAGSLVGTALDNTGLDEDTGANINKQVAFALGANDTGWQPPQDYFLIMGATSAFDRVDEPMLLVKATQRALA